MRHGSLFSGIGGFDLAADWMGWENVFHCEWNKFGQAVLKHHFPNSISYDDITKTDFTIHRGGIDILTGGFPCQPYSTAGKRKGKDDDRHLWPSMLRAIREIKPTWIVGENVRGLVSWNGGMVFDEVQSDLEAEGYEVIPLLLPACAVNAPHRRDRIWFVAYSNHKRSSYESGEVQGANEEVPKRNDSSELSNSSNVATPHPDEILLQFSEDTREMGRRQAEVSGYGDKPTKSTQADGEAGAATDTNIQLSQGRCDKDRPQTAKRHIGSYFQPNTWQNFPTQSPIRGGDDGLSDILDSDSVLKATGGRKAESNWVKESIKAYGNAVVPQVVYQIFKSIDELNKTT